MGILSDADAQAQRHIDELNRRNEHKSLPHPSDSDYDQVMKGLYEKRKDGHQFVRYSDAFPAMCAVCRGPHGEDNVNHPSHYTAYKGLEVIDLTEQMNFNLGNAVKYICRAGLKSPESLVEDLEKAAWYIAREIERIKWEVVDPEPLNDETRIRSRRK